MATAKLGIIVTEIAGTIGGVTFRRHRGTTVVGIKSVGGAKSILLQNPRLGNLRTLVNNWGLLPVATRDNWDTAALLFTFPDKFGDQRNLSGRELYLKLQGHQIVIGGGALDPTALASAINLGVNPLLFISAYGSLNYLSDFSIDIDGNSVQRMIVTVPVNNIFLENNVLQLNPTIDNDSHLLIIPNANTNTILNEEYKITGRYLIASGNTIITGFRIANDVQSEVSGNIIFNNEATNIWHDFELIYIAEGADTRFYAIITNGDLNYIGDINDKIYFKDIMYQKGGILSSTITFDATIANTNILIQTELLKNNAIAPTFTRRQVIAFKNMNAVSFYDFSALLLEKFPEIKAGDLIRIYITYQNLSGFRTVPITLETNVIE